MSEIDYLIDELFRNCPESKSTNDGTLLNEILQIKSICSQYKRCMRLLNYKELFDEDRITFTQLVMDKFCESYASFFGGYKITSYLHIMWGGHLRTFLRIFGNIYIFANHGFEGNTCLLHSNFA
jgi:hypothetical protein